MRFYVLLKVLFSTLLSVLLSACVMYQPSPNDPQFAPVVPQIPVAPKSEPGAIYNRASAGFLFEDRRAHTIGDLITIRLAENTQAQKKADTKVKKNDALDMAGASLLGAPVTFNGNDILNGTLSNNRDFKAESESKQSNSLTGSVTVMVVDVMSNGYLLLRGDKWLTINQGEEFVRITGIVRPEDVGPDNTVVSTRVANARISYSGTGQMAEANSRGWLSRFFSADWWPF